MKFKYWLHLLSKNKRMFVKVERFKRGSLKIQLNLFHQNILTKNWFEIRTNTVNVSEFLLLLLLLLLLLSEKISFIVFKVLIKPFDVP